MCTVVAQASQKHAWPRRNTNNASITLYCQINLASSRSHSLLQLLACHRHRCCYQRPALLCSVLIGSVDSQLLWGPVLWLTSLENCTRVYVPLSKRLMRLLIRASFFKFLSEIATCQIVLKAAGRVGSCITIINGSAKPESWLKACTTGGTRGLK